MLCALAVGVGGRSLLRVRHINTLRVCIQQLDCTSQHVRNEPRESAAVILLSIAMNCVRTYELRELRIRSEWLQASSLRRAATNYSQLRCQLPALRSCNNMTCNPSPTLNCPALYLIGALKAVLTLHVSLERTVAVTQLPHDAVLVIQAVEASAPPLTAKRVPTLAPLGAANSGTRRCSAGWLTEGGRGCEYGVQQANANRRATTPAISDSTRPAQHACGWRRPPPRPGGGPWAVAAGLAGGAAQASLI